MERSKTIDILRAIAVFLVLGRHLDLCPVEADPLFRRFTALWFRGGWIGVDLFFVLSGFLVSGLLFREHEKFGYISAKQFLVRRGFKIYPAFWLLILATIAKAAHGHYTVSLGKVASELLFVQNYGSYLWTHTWSLAVEEHFYFLLLLFLLVLSRRCRGPKAFRLVPTAFVILAAGCLTLRVLTASVMPYSDKTHLFPSHLRMDSLFAGVFISYLYHSNRDCLLAWGRRNRVKLLMLGVLLLAPAFVFPLGSTRFIYTFGLTLFYIGSGFLLIVALVSRAPQHWTGRALAYAGSHSYSIYLWHLPIAWWAVPKLSRFPSFDRNWFIYAGAYLIGSVSFGIVMATLIEFPVLRLRDYFFPSRGRPLTVSTITPGSASPQNGDAVTIEKPSSAPLQTGSATLPSDSPLSAAGCNPESYG